MVGHNPLTYQIPCLYFFQIARLIYLPCRELVVELIEVKTLLLLNHEALYEVAPQDLIMKTLLISRNYHT